MQILRDRELLARYGLLDKEGRLNKTLLLALLDAAPQEESLKETVLNYLLKERADRAAVRDPSKD